MRLKLSQPNLDEVGAWAELGTFPTNSLDQEGSYIKAAG